MIEAIKLWLQLHWAGSGEMYGDLAWGIGMIALCALGAWFSPVLKKDFIFAALVVLAALLFEARGIHVEKVHDAAQGKVIRTAVSKAVARTQTPAAKKSTDPWDNRNY